MKKLLAILIVLIAVPSFAGEYTDLVEKVEQKKSKWSLGTNIGVTIPTGDFEKRGTFISASLKRNAWMFELSRTESSTDECGQTNVDLEWIALTLGYQINIKNVMVKNDFVFYSAAVGGAYPQYADGTFSSSGSTEGEGNMRRILKNTDVNGINGVNTGPNWFQDTSRKIRAAPVVDFKIGYGVDFKYGKLLLVIYYRYLRSETKLKAWNTDANGNRTAYWVTITDEKYDKVIPTLSYVLPFSDIKRMFKR